MRYKRIILVILLALCFVSDSVRAKAQPCLEKERLEVGARERRKQKRRDALAYKRWLKKIEEQVVFVSWINAVTGAVLSTFSPGLKDMGGIKFIMMFGVFSIIGNRVGGPKVEEWKEYVGITVAGLVSGFISVYGYFIKVKGSPACFVAGLVGMVAGKFSMEIARELMRRYERRK